MIAMIDSGGTVCTKELFDINCLWLGRFLRPLEQICLLSMLRQGHHVRLFCYDKIENVPSGIEIADANQFLPRENFKFYKNGSAALGSNIFRYLLMKNNLGLWLDTDILLLRPLYKENNPVFGKEDCHLINNAVLYLPATLEVLSSLLYFVQAEYPIPPFFSAHKRFSLMKKKILGFPVHVSDMPWGIYGPQALTFFLKKHNLGNMAKPRDFFYPIHWADAHSLFVANLNTENLITSRTICVHLWNECLRIPSSIRPENPIGKLIVEKNSFVEKFASEELGFNLESE